MSEWKKCKLGDIAEIIGGGTPSTKNSNYWGGTIPWLTPRDLTNFKGVYISHGERFITKTGLQNSSAKLMPKGSVLLTSRAPIGYLAIADNEICTNQGFKNLVPNLEICDNKFLYYWLKTNIDYLKQLGTGTTFAEISGSIVKEVEISLPPLKEQKRIAEILSSLDDKIDLLNRQNETLEDLAQTLFRQWFVEEADDEWGIVTLDDICLRIASGGTPSTKNESYYGGDINWYATKELKDNFLFNSESKITKSGLENSSAKLFPKDTVVIAIYAAPTVGRLGILSNESSFNQATCGLIPNNEICCKEFLYLYLKAERDNLNTMASGSAQQNLNVGKIKNYEVPLVDKNTMSKFKSRIQPMFNKIYKNSEQILTLENLRDTLLPKLMSGEVGV